TVYYWQPGSDLEPRGDFVTDLEKPSHILIDKINDYYYLVILDNTNKRAKPYRAYYKDLFPGSTQGSIALSAFVRLQQVQFSLNMDLGCQAQPVRDFTETWYVLTSTSTNTDGDGDACVAGLNITFDDVVTLSGGPENPPSSGCGPGYTHIFLPAGETSFTN